MHVWERLTDSGTDYVADPNPDAYQEGYADYVAPSYEIGELQASPFPLHRGSSSSSYSTWQYGTEIVVADDGTVTLSGTTGSGKYGYANGDNKLYGKFIRKSGTSDIYKVEAASYSGLSQGHYDDGYGADLPSDVKVWKVNVFPATWTAIFTYLGQLGDKARIEVGSYVGTGKYGSGNKNSITFEFEPKFVYIAVQTPNNNVNGGRPHTWFWVKGSGFMYNDSTHQSSGDVTNVYCTLTQSGNTISWYSSAGTSYAPAERQANVSGKTYNYIAIG